MSAVDTAVNTTVDTIMATTVLEPAASPAKVAGAAEARFLYLDQEAVLAAGVFDMARAMAVVAAALVAWRRGRARQPHKVVLRAGETEACERQWRINGLCAALGEPVEAVGMKWIASFPPNRAQGLPRASGMLILNSPVNGLPIAVMDATLISAVRTGAITGLGARYLAPRGARRAAIVGAGVQARTQALALMTACPHLDGITILHPRRTAAQDCAEDVRRRWNVPALGSADFEATLKEADIVVTATTAEEPLLGAAAIKPGALTVQIAGHEYDFELVNECAKIVCDDWETVKHRGIPTPARMHAAGLLPDERIHANLAELLTGERGGRESERERIHFAHIGLGLDDVALGADLYERARQLELGQWLRLWRTPLWV